jgi:hypothetical protein
LKKVGRFAIYSSERRKIKSVKKGAGQIKTTCGFIDYFCPNLYLQNIAN